MGKAEKHEGKLTEKQKKLVSENPEKWENSKLLSSFGLDQIKKISELYKGKCL